VLTAEAGTAINDSINAAYSGASTNTVGIAGTGYNDTFFATLGTDLYNGGGGTVTVSGVKAWSDTGGMDIVDYKLAGTAKLKVDLSQTSPQNTGFGTATFKNIEGIAGAGGDDVFTDNAADNQFEGRGGADTFKLTGGGNDTLLYTVQDKTDATGGNGADTVEGFKVGTWEATANADRIDLSNLLIGYVPDLNGAAHYINGVPTLDVGERIGEYLKVTNDGTDSILWINRDGLGDQFDFTPLLTLKGVVTNLETLLANHQIVMDPAGLITVDTLTTVDTTPVITGTVQGLLDGVQIWITVNGKTYRQGVDSELAVTGAVWTLRIGDADALNVDGATNLVLDVKAQLIGAVGATGDETTREVTILGDVTVALPLEADYVADTRPTLIGQGSANVALGEKLVVEVSDGATVYTFSTDDGKVVLNANGGWTLGATAWGQDLNAGVTYTVTAKTINSDKSVARTSEAEHFTVVAPVTNTSLASLAGGDDAAPKVYTLADGSYWVFWAHDYNNNTDGNYYRIWGRHYDANGGVLSQTIFVADNTNSGYSGSGATNFQYIANYDVRFKAGGDFSVFYSNEGGTQTYVRNFSANGDPTGAATTATNSANYDLLPTYVDMGSDGYAWAWVGGTYQDFQVYVQRFNSSGAAKDVNPVAATSGSNLNNGFSYNLAGDQGYPTVIGGGNAQLAATTQGMSAANIGGSQYALLYMSSKANATSATNTDMYLKVFDFNTGATVVNDLKVNTFTGGYQIGAQVIALKEGGFVTVWASNHEGVTGTGDGTMDAFNVYARRFEMKGNVAQALETAEVQVNTSTNGVNGVAYDRLTVNFSGAALAQGGYVIVWSKFTGTGEAEVYGQIFDAAGNKLGGETLVSTSSAGLDMTPTVTGLADGGYVVAWVHSGASNYWNTNTGDVYMATVNADGSIRGSGAVSTDVAGASYLDGAGLNSTLTGDDAVNTLDGRDGATTLHAGGGDDVIIVKDAHFTQVDGGAGTDTLVWDSTQNLDFSQIADKTSGIEVIHLGDQNANTLTLTVADVLAASESSDALVVQGGAGDTVNLDGGWHSIGTQMWRGETYQVYLNEQSADASVWIQRDVAVEVDEGKLIGTDGDNTLTVDAGGFTHIDAGAGFDTLNVTGSGLTLDFDNVKGVEAVNLGVGGGNTLSVSLQDVLNMPDATDNLLRISGDETDTVHLSGFTPTGTVQTVDGVDYDVWQGGNGTDVATLLLEQSVVVQQV
jgi:hypothetical protein